MDCATKHALGCFDNFIANVVTLRYYDSYKIISTILVCN
jgi:hypothetical protein